MRLIDADALRAELHVEFTAWGYTVPEDGEPSGGGTALNIVDRALDAAPTVRCGDCSYDSGDGGPGAVWCRVRCLWETPDDCCARFARRTP